MLAQRRQRQRQRQADAATAGDGCAAHLALLIFKAWGSKALSGQQPWVTGGVVEDADELAAKVDALHDRHHAFEVFHNILATPVPIIFLARLHVRQRVISRGMGQVEMSTSGARGEPTAAHRRINHLTFVVLKIVFCIHIIAIFSCSCFPSLLKSRETFATILLSFLVLTLTLARHL